MALSGAPTSRRTGSLFRTAPLSLVHSVFCLSAALAKVRSFSKNRFEFHNNKFAPFTD